MAAAAVASRSSEWIPETDAEKKLKEALGTMLISSPSSVITKAPDNKTNRLILQTQGYHDLYTYVVHGSALPGSTESFENEYKRSSFAAIDAIDASAYVLLRDTTVGIAKHCKEFNKNGLEKLTTSADGTIEYANLCIDLIRGKADTGTHGAFDVLLDRKYATKPKDEKFSEALERASSNLQGLKALADKNAEATGEVVTVLEQFYTQTKGDAQGVASVEETFISGPMDAVTHKQKLKADGKPQEPYSEIMNAKLAQLQEEIALFTKMRAEDEDYWNNFGKPAKDFQPVIRLPEFFRSSFADAMRNNAIAKWDKNIAKDNQEKIDVTKVLELAKDYANTPHSLLPKVQTAMKAMNELQKLFVEQRQNLGAIQDNLTSLQGGISATSWEHRKTWINGAIQVAVEKFNEIKRLGEEFKRGATPEVDKS